MAIDTDSGIWTFGTQDEVSSTPGTVATDKMVNAGLTTWTNDDDAPYASAVLKCQFDTTMPTVGSLVLVAHCKSVQSTNNIQVPDTTTPDNFAFERVGVFPIPLGVSADTDFYTGISLFDIPAYVTAQPIEWYLWNRATAQTVGTSWQLWITPKALKPHPA